MNLSDNEIQVLKKSFENIIHLARLTEFYRREAELSDMNPKIRVVIDNLLTNAQAELSVCSNFIFDIMDLNAADDNFEIQYIIDMYTKDSEPEEV